MTVASKDDVDGIVEIDVDRISPKITTVIFDVDDTLYDVSTVSLVAVVVIIIVSCFLSPGRSSPRQISLCPVLAT
jgi:hypothetical protein